MLTASKRHVTAGLLYQRLRWGTLVCTYGDRCMYQAGHVARKPGLALVSYGLPEQRQDCGDREFLAREPSC